MKNLAIPFLILVSLVMSAYAMPEFQVTTGDITDAAREVLDKHASSVVTVGGILSVDLGMMGQQEPEFEIVGTVVNDSGLTVVSNSELNPLGDETHEFEPQPGMSVTISAKIEQVWLQLEDGTRLEAMVVMKDADLDLAFIRPIDQTATENASLTPVALDRVASKASVFDEVITLARLSHHAGWTTSLKLQRVHAVIQKPRQCYELGSELGSAVFNASGLLLGITVNLQDSDEGLDVGRFLMRGPEGMGVPVVLPVSEIVSLIKQASEL